MESIVDIVLGGTHTEEQLNEFAAKLPEEGKKLFNEAKAFVTKRQDEEKKFGLTEEQRKESERLATEAEERLRKAEEDLKIVEEKKATTQQETSQFRQEQIGKAKEAFFNEYKIPEDQQALYEAEFAKLDSGKVDPDLIKKDFVKAYAALNVDTLLEKAKTADTLRENADKDGQQAAGSHSSQPADITDPSKFSEQAQGLAKAADIPVETAERINKEGMTRQIG